MKPSRTPLGQYREKVLELDQSQIAALLKTSQPEVCRTENGDAPKRDDLLRWARAYRLTMKRFRLMCAEAREMRKQREQWALPLWGYGACNTEAGIEHIDCTLKEVKSA